MLTKRYPSRDGCFGVTVTPQIVRETDQLRGDIPRSRWVERALVMYNRRVKGEKEGKEKEDNQNGVKGNTAVHQPSLPPATPTPTTSTEVTRTTTVLDIQPTQRRSGL